jgi:hypothetical protein
MKKLSLFLMLVTGIGRAVLASTNGSLALFLHIHNHTGKPVWCVYRANNVEPQEIKPNTNGKCWKNAMIEFDYIKNDGAKDRKPLASNFDGTMFIMIGGGHTDSIVHKIGLSNSKDHNGKEKVVSTANIEKTCKDAGGYLHPISDDMKGQSLSSICEIKSPGLDSITLYQ